MKEKSEVLCGFEVKGLSRIHPGKDAVVQKDCHQTSAFEIAILPLRLQVPNNHILTQLPIPPYPNTRLLRT